MATINPNQDYDMIQTLTFEEASGTCNIRLYRGSSSAFSGTVYYRAGTSGNWTSLSVTGTSTTFPVTSTTMQVAHDWNKDGDNYMTCSFYNQSTNLKGIKMSQKAPLSGTLGNFFMYYYASGCSSLTSLDVPDTSNITTVGSSFMNSYAQGCSLLTHLDVPDTSNITTVGSSFMSSYAQDCSSLTSLDVPNTSNVNLTVGSITVNGPYFMHSYAKNCSSLTHLDVPDTSNLTAVGGGFMTNYAQGCSSLTHLDVPDTSNFTYLGLTIDSGFMSGYADGCSSLISLSIPNVSGDLEYSGILFMSDYAKNCSSLTKLILPKAGWFKDHDVSWSVPSDRLGILKGVVINEDDVQDWKDLTEEGRTLYINYIRNSDDVSLRVLFLKQENGRFLIINDDKLIKIKKED